MGTPVDVPWQRGTAQSGDIAIAYEHLGSGAPLILAMGIGAQRVFWADAWCAAIAARGFRVLRYDHRDLGESSRLPGAVAPRPADVLRQRLLGQRVVASHTLSDLARDVIAIADDAGLDRFHVMGVSMGGMIAQTLAIEHGPRLRTMTSIMSAPGDRRYLPQRAAMRALLGKPPQSVDEAVTSAVRLFTAIGSPSYPLDEATVGGMARAAWARGTSPLGVRRHFAAIMASGSRRALLPTVRVPTLVIHGTHDPLIPVAAGRATAALIPDAVWLPLACMGHDLPDALWPTIIDALCRHVARAAAA